MKLMLWLAKLAVSAVVTSLCCLALTFFAVNSYVDLLLEQYHIPRQAGQSIQWNQLVSHMAKQFDSMVGMGGSGKPPADREVAAVSGNPTDEKKQERTGTETGGQTPKPSSTTERKPPEDAVAVWSRQSVSSMTSEEDRKVVVSGEEFAKKKDELTQEQKNKIFSVISKLPQEDIQYISKLMENGITASELKELEQILQKRLQPEEYADLLKLLKP
ncbi:hypothetical protein RAC89_11900 [Paenibacillus sp. GD4]|jgi:hypothetical protein|uniref:hypothetical protein n=1 Tax=Paenibacillus sp. GD4 TaxID=3068890 RepID=UPI002796BD79|nr:hypothetical protein [Paenibacillus sp. GD4]MDQ1911156.1 hypothetical protein [Paenibacillus sp. GD4]